MTAAPLPRKRHPRQHVIADLSVNHVERIILEAGHAIQRPTSDYGYDLMVATFDEQGYAEPGLVLLQFKAAESLDEGLHFAFDIDVRDYNLWMMEELPVLLVLYDAGRRKAYWVCVQTYFERTGQQPRRGAKTIRALVPRRQLLSRRGINLIQAMKRDWVTRIARYT
jgi:hypothetical protein